MTLRIAIVNDMELSRRVLRQAVGQQADWKLAWEAHDGVQAVARCQQDRPDLILMDMYMPDMNGVLVTREIMATAPCAILVVTAGIEKNTAMVFEALAAGALDAVDTPAGISAQSLSALVAKIRTIAKLIGDRPQLTPSMAPTLRQAHATTLVAVGASTGGPAALRLLLEQLPADFPAAVVIAQHIDAKFAAEMANWLGLVCKLPVRVIRPGDRAEAGQVLLAGTNEHIVFGEDARLYYSVEPVNQPYRPSVDELFASAALNWRGPIVGVLLTGMGQDGACGLLALRRLGHYTMAQDQDSSVVYGMPAAAARFGAAMVQMTPQQIGQELTRIIRIQPAN